MYNERIVADIRDANPARSPDCLRRRLLKILEELGENCEAYLSKTGEGNYKNKSWEDYREEGADTLIVMVDVALTRLPNTTWPSEAFLHLHIDEGRANPVTTFEEMEAIKFEIARAVCSADHFLRQREGSAGFYGAATRGVKAAAKLCYASIPGEHLEDLDQRVIDVITQKLAKWRGRSTAKTLDMALAAMPKMSKPYAGDGDLKIYMEKFD